MVIHIYQEDFGGYHSNYMAQCRRSVRCGRVGKGGVRGGDSTAGGQGDGLRMKHAGSEM